MSVSLSEVSQSIAGAVDAASAHVVRVEARRRHASTGVLWAEGLVVTAHHAVEREEGIVIGLPDGSEGRAQLVGRDPTTDLAVLKLEAPVAFTPPAFEDGAGLKVGHLVLALGRPGRTVRASLGILSAVGKSWRTPGGTEVSQYLEADAQLPPGFSGGPLVSASGRLVGINSSGLLRGTGAILPAATVSKVVQELGAHGRMRRGYLGVGAQPVRLPPSLRAAAQAEGGLILVSVEPGGPADKAGLTLGDTLVGFDGAPVSDLGQLWSTLTEERIGQALAARVVRGGELKEVQVVVGQRP